MSKRDYKIYLDDIILSSSKIQEYIKGISFDGFVKNGQLVDAVIRNIEIVGEAAKNLPNSLKNKHKSIPWKEIVSTRNRVTHEYFGVNLKIIWKAVKLEIPRLKREVQKILRVED